MKENNKENILNEHIDKIKYRIGYKVNETPKYKPVIDDDLEYDELPAEVYATQDGFPVPNTGGSDAYLEEEDNEKEDDFPPEETGSTDPVEPSNATEPNQEDVPEIESEPEPTSDNDEMEDNTKIQPDTEIEQPIEEPAEENEVDELQNDIIKHNIEAMRNIQSKLEDLENINNTLNNQLNTLNKKVEEVEEPTNTEKLLKKKENSYPFYFNLNDFWKNNWFDQQRESMEEKGIRELPDGTFIADFDDLDTHNDMDVEDSFNSII